VTLEQLLLGQVRARARVRGRGRGRVRTSVGLSKGCSAAMIYEGEVSRHVGNSSINEVIGSSRKLY